MTGSDSVVEALKKSKFGRLKYSDRWLEPRNVQALFDKWASHEKHLDLLLDQDAEVSFDTSCSEPENIEIICDSTQRSSLHVVDKKPALVSSPESPSAYDSRTLEYFAKLAAHKQKWDDTIRKRIDACSREFRQKHTVHMVALRQKLEACTISYNVKDDVCDKEQPTVTDVVPEDDNSIHYAEPATQSIDANVVPSPTPLQSSDSDNTNTKRRAEFEKYCSLIEEQCNFYQSVQDCMSKLETAIKSKVSQLVTFIVEKYGSIRRSNSALSVDDKTMKTLKELHKTFHDVLCFVVDAMKNATPVVQSKQPASPVKQDHQRLSEEYTNKAVRPPPQLIPVTRPKDTAISGNNSANQDSQIKFDFRLPNKQEVQAAASAVVPSRTRAVEHSLPDSYIGTATSDSYAEFVESMDLLDEQEKIMASLIGDLSNKQLCTTLNRAVTALINKISGMNFLSSFNKMLRLLKCETVDVCRDCRVCLRNQPRARSLCINLMCRRILNCLVKNLNESPSAIFYSAAFSVGICSHFPDVKQLFLAHLYATCPILLPFYVRTAAADKNNARGLEIILGVELDDDGKPTLGDHLLKPVVAYSRFFAALFVTPPPPSTANSNKHYSSPQISFNFTLPGATNTSSSSPFKLSTVWNLLVNILQLEPRFQYTSIVLNEILKVTGFALKRTYGQAFVRLLAEMKANFIPKIREANRGFNVGAFVDLNTHLDKGDYTSREPEGFLGDKVWSSSSNLFYRGITY